MPRIICDVHEVRSGVPADLARLGAELEIRSLARGDYVVAIDAIVERKAIADLHSSIVEGRFWAQMAKIRLARRPYLLIESRVASISRIQCGNASSHFPATSPDQISGCVGCRA